MSGRLAAAALLLWCFGCDPNVVVGRGVSRVAPLEAGSGPDPEAGESAAGAGGETAPLPEAGESGDAAMPPMDAAVGMPDAEVPPMEAGPPPEVSWPTGAHPSAELPGFIAFAEWRGRPLDVAHVFSDRRTWTGVSQPDWPLGVFEPFDGTLVMSQPFFPEGSGGTTALCAEGEYDDEWENMGRVLVEYDRGDTILRPGWGFNDEGKEWRVDPDPTNWVTCFQRLVDAVRRTAPEVRIVWSFNAYVSSIPEGGNPYDAYPDDEYVDFVGMDIYDMDPPSFDQAQWDERCYGVAGLCTLMQFARDHGKRVAVGEWGVASCGTDPGGDNPFFIEKMFETFAANTDIMAFEAYFEDSAAGVCSSIMDGGANPNASQKYKMLYGPR